MRKLSMVTALLTIPLVLQSPVCSLSALASTSNQASASRSTVAAGTADLPKVEFHVKSEADSEEESSTPKLAQQARSAVVMDYATGKILFEKDAHEKLPPASVTKVMTLLLVMEALDSGKLHLNDQVKVSEHAASMGGSQIFLKPGETMSVNDLLKGIAMASANDGCVAIAEHMYGTEDEFVAQMNKKAKELGMADTHFENCNGLPVEGHYTSAHDIALMSRELLKHPMITKYTSVYTDYLRKDTDHPFWLVNTNKLVRFYPGLDGLKTGYTSEAKYCLSATAKKDGFRVITVVMGEPKIQVRNQEVSELLNWAFAEYRSKVLYNRGAVVKEVEVAHGTPERVAVETADTLGLIEHKGEKVQYVTRVDIKPVKAPLKKGQEVGTLSVLREGEQVASVPLVVSRDVEKAGFLTGLGRTIRKLVTFGAGK